MDQALPQKPIAKNNTPNIIATIVLGAARLGSSAALVHLGVQGALTDMGASQNLGLGMSIHSAISNIATTSFTRVTSIYNDNYPYKLKNFFNPQQNINRNSNDQTPC